MKNKLVLIAVLMLALGIAAAVLYSREVRKEIDKDNARIASEKNQGEADKYAGIGGMNIDAMEIVQGEKGSEQWRLVAIAASMVEGTGDIVAQKPLLTYYLVQEHPTEEMAGNRDFLLVESQTGDVNQSKGIIRFVDDVVVTHGEDRLTTDILLYDDVSKRLNSPNEAFFISVGIDGRADKMFWDLKEDTLHATGSVSINLETQRR